MTNQPSQLRPAIVLVTDRTLSARYRILFEGILATMQTTQVPEIGMRRFLAPTVTSDASGRATAAPLGLRRIEAALLAAGFAPDQVACVTPEGLKRVLGPWTKIVAVSSSDPLGQGMTNTTTTQFWSGKLYTQVWMDRMMRQLVAAKAQFGFRLIGGGGGAWQWIQNPEAAKRHGLDCIFDGYFEAQGPALFQTALNGKPLPEIVREERTAVGQVRQITGPSVLGAVELSRGCGKGCRFCTSAFRPMEHLPAETILADVQMNVAAHQRAIVSGSEDFFRYGASGPKANFEALRSLLEAMQRIDGISFMQIDHANVSSVIQYSDKELAEIRRLLTFGRDVEYLWVNMGIESANGHLLGRHSPGKFAPFQADDWESMVLDAAERITRNGFFPVFSVILGLPGETPDDVVRTRKLVERIAQMRAVVFPIFHEPVLPEARTAGESFGRRQLTQEHLDLYIACYENNFRRVPPLFWDNQRAGGVSLLKRLAIQLLGKFEVRAWRKNFRIARREIESKS